jgi:diacylglycerol O-acyltransferase
MRLRGLPMLARLPLRAGASVGDVVRLAAGLRPRTAPSAGSLNGPIGVHRRWSWAEVELADVRSSATRSVARSMMWCWPP